jgi:hypothetical protein
MLKNVALRDPICHRSEVRAPSSSGAATAGDEFGDRWSCRTLSFRCRPSLRFTPMCAKADDRGSVLHAELGPEYFVVVVQR